MALADTLKNLAGVLGLVGAQGGDALANAMQAQGNPVAYQQMQENQRQQNALDAAAQGAQTLTAYQQAELARQAMQDKQNTGLQTWQILASGFRPTPQGTSPDFNFNGQGFSAPPAAQTHSILADSPVGKSLGLSDDLTGLSTDEYARYVLPQLEKLSVAQDKASQFAANGKALDSAMPSNVALIRQRFSPAYYQTLGAIDPSASTLAANFESRLTAAAESDKKSGTMAKTAEVMKDLAGFQSAWEKSRTAQLQRQLEISARAAQNRQTESDRSYMYHEKELDSLAKPVNDLSAKIADINSELNQGSPISDALAVPKLLSVLVGGQGSGLRMTGAEIDRIAGARNALGNFQVFANHLALDPSKANTITPEQRREMRALVGEVQKRVQAKQSALNGAYASLAGSEDPLEHRRIYDKARKAVLDVDSTPASGSIVDSLVSKYGGR